MRDAIVAAAARSAATSESAWSLPVVGETWDGWLNDVDGQHVRAEHLDSALAAARGGAVAEGNVGGGTGMICHRFKGGIGSASRQLPQAEGGFMVGALVQANYGRRERLAIDGVPVGREIGLDEVPSDREDAAADPSDADAGSIIVVLATDAPLLPHQCERLAQRAGLGVARTGGAGEHSSGDLFVAFATGNRGLVAQDRAAGRPFTREVRALDDAWISPLFWAAIESTEEAIVNALVAAETMAGPGWPRRAPSPARSPRGSLGALSGAATALNRPDPGFPTRAPDARRGGRPRQGRACWSGEAGQASWSCAAGSWAILRAPFLPGSRDRLVHSSSAPSYMATSSKPMRCRTKAAKAP